MTPTYLVVALVTAALLIYLLVALLAPEKLG
jgi:K+-transporting ATPase KdpF subunit